MLINLYSGTRWEVLSLFLFNNREGWGAEWFNRLCLVYRCWRIKFYARSQFFQGTYQHLLLKCHKISQALYCCIRREHLAVDVVCATEHAYTDEIAQEHRTCAHFEFDSGVFSCVYLCAVGRATSLFSVLFSLYLRHAFLFSSCLEEFRAWRNCTSSGFLSCF